MSRTVGILFVSWFCIVSVTEAALGTSCNETADSSNCEATESCTNSSCVCSDGYFDVDGNCVSNSISVTLNANATSIVYGSSVVLTATITSAVSVDTVQWQKGEMIININQEKYTQSNVGSNQVTLTITNLVTNDGGSYRVQVNNSAGTISDWSTSVTLTVTGERPTVDVGTISEMGTTVTIHCNASVSQGSPALTDIHWLVNNVSLSLTDNNKYSGGNLNTPSLTINNIASTDIGEYRCVATNLVGSTTSSQSVTLAAPSVGTILQQPAGAVNHSSSVTFTGSYTSLLNATVVKWQKPNGSNFIDIDITTDKYTGSSVTGPSPKLVINSVQFMDETSYGLVVSNGVGSAQSSFITLNVEGGILTVTTGSNVTGRFGGSVTIGCTVTGPEVNKIQWIKYINNAPVNITIDGQKFSGGSLSTHDLTIKSLTNNDARQYQCTANNPGGTYSSANRASVQVNYGQFNEPCNNLEPCEDSKFLTCNKDNKCLCMNTHYHKDRKCYPKTGIAPTNIFLNSTTNMFFVFWSNPTNDYELVSGYEVTWRFLGSMTNTSGQLEKNVNHYTVSSNLMSGQLYTVAVISEVTLTNPADSFVQTSNDTPVRLAPSAPGPVIPSRSNFAHNNLIINWTAPVNTVVTKYEVTIDGTTYTTMSSDAMYQFTGKVFVPGKSYNISIVTVSGTTSDIVKRSLEHTEWIRTTPTKPKPPTNLKCPQSPLDVSLEISWIAPTEPNGIIRMYQINVNQGSLGQVYTLSNETHKNVEGLSPEQEYIFTVNTINDAPLTPTSDQSQPITCKTKAGVSTAPTDMEIDEINSRGFRIEFNIPDNVKGILAAYKIVISKKGNCVQQILVQGNCSICMSTDDCPSPINYTVPNITNAVSYTASNLYPYTKYMVKVVAINGEGEGHPVNTTVTTEEEVPPQPGQITASNIKNSSLTLDWTLTDTSPGNTTYTIYTYESIDATGTNFLMKKSSKVYGFDTKTLLVTGLDEYWPYKFKVNAATVKGNTTSEFSSVFRTNQGAPGQVLNLTVQKKGNDFRTAYVSWSPPALRDHNGVLQSYLFSSNHTGAIKEVQIPVLSSQATVEKNISVTPEAVYVIEVVLQNNESTKSQPSMQIYRAPAGPPPVTNIEPLTTKPGEHKPTTNTITIEINTTYFKNNDNGKQVFVGVAVCAESKCIDKRVMPERTLLHYWKDLPNWHEASKDGFPLYRVTNDTFKDKVINGGSRRRRSVNSGTTTELVIGEDITCPSLNKDVYCNGQLSAGKSYNVFIFACTSGGCTYSKADGAFSTQKVPDKEDNAMNIIIGVVVAVVVVAVIVGVAFVVVKRRNRLGETKQYTKGLDNQTTLDEPVPKNIPRKRPIKLKELSDKVAEKHKDSNLHFAREYEDLKALSPKHPAETSELDNNKLKNRYVNILPFDHSRVKLMLTEDDDPSTDFINANYLPGYKSQREYIATQGPIPGTIDDFWRMIWEQNVSIIVMLTLCKEEGRVKCEMYWPENIHEPKQYGDLVVETVSNSTVNFYEFRIFKIKLGDTTRSVKHFHFLQWKDFSANVQNDVMIDFIKNVRNHIRPPDMNGPVVVHCSAGVGRTGTYCALDHLFQFVDEHDLDESIDIFDLVMNLRERRMFMVQTEQQYIFIHDCLKDYLEKKLAKDECLYENQAFVADDEPVEESLYQNYNNQRTDL